MNKYKQFSKANKQRRKTFKKIHGRGRFQCVKKRSHDSKESALKWQSSNGFPEKRAYHCPHCFKWHLATPKRKRDEQK